MNLGLYPTSNIGNDALTNQPDNIPYLKDERIRHLYQAISLSGSLEFDLKSTKKLWDQIRSDYEALDLGVSKKNIILSHESITSARFANSSLLEKASRIRDVFGPIKIIIVVRRQQDVLKSLYRDHPFDPRTMESQPRPVNFNEWLEIDLSRKSLSLAHSLYYDRLAYLYDEFFGKENVLVLPMELMQVDLESFSGILSKFLGIDSGATFRLLGRPPTNTSVSHLGNQYRSLKSKFAPVIKYLKFLKTPLMNFDHSLFNLVKKIGSPTKVEITTEQEICLKKMYAKGNLDLSQDRSLSLHSLGYYVEQSV